MIVKVIILVSGRGCNFEVIFNDIKRKYKVKIIGNKTKKYGIKIKGIRQMKEKFRIKIIRND